MPVDDPTPERDLLNPGLSTRAQRAGKALAKLNEEELLAVLGIELQRRGLQELGALPKPRVAAKRKEAGKVEQLMLALPLLDVMTDDHATQAQESALARAIQR